MKWQRIFSSLFWIQAGVNLVGVWGPEISFDALWYHLPLARFMAERNWWGVIPGGLLYMSGSPRLTEFMNAGLYTIALAMGLPSPEILLKLTVYCVGLLSAALIYRISRIFLDSHYSWGATLFWYCNLVVGWQSIVVYSDLYRAFFTLLALWCELTWLRTRDWRYVALGGLTWAMAFSTKVFAAVDFAVLSLVLVYFERWTVLGLLGMGSMIAVSEIGWGLLNVRSGYHFLYPFVGKDVYMPLTVPSTASYWLPVIQQFFHFNSRTGPFVLIPIALARRSWWSHVPRYLLIFAVSLFLSWWLTPMGIGKGGGRYFLPTLAVFSILAAHAVTTLGVRTRTVIAYLVISIALFGIGYRAVANSKFVPSILKWESKSQFLAEHLNYEFGDWSDIDGWVTSNIADKKYLVIGVHNTYYLPGHLWDHTSWAAPTHCYQYILVQGDYPIHPSWRLIHSVEKTYTRIYHVPDCSL